MMNLESSMMNEFSALVAENKAHTPPCGGVSNYYSVEINNLQYGGLLSRLISTCFLLCFMFDYFLFCFYFIFFKFWMIDPTYCIELILSQGYYDFDMNF